MNFFNTFKLLKKLTNIIENLIGNTLFYKYKKGTLCNTYF